MSMDVANKIISLKQDIVNKETQLAETEGTLRAYRDELKKFGCDTLKQAEKKLSAFDEADAALRKEIEEVETKLKNLLDSWQ